MTLDNLDLSDPDPAPTPDPTVILPRVPALDPGSCAPASHRPGESILAGGNAYSDGTYAENETLVIDGHVPLRRKRYLKILGPMRPTLVLPRHQRCLRGRLGGRIVAPGTSFDLKHGSDNRVTQIGGSWFYMSSSGRDAQWLRRTTALWYSLCRPPLMTTADGDRRPWVTLRHQRCDDLRLVIRSGPTVLPTRQRRHGHRLGADRLTWYHFAGRVNG